MKITIQGTVYDTDTARLIGRASASGKPSTSWRAGLYRTAKSRRYFLAGEGGSMTRWADDAGIFVLEPHEARAWAEEYLEDLTDDELLAAFA
jgi:hypothetical protein